MFRYKVVPFFLRLVVYDFLNRILSTILGTVEWCGGHTRNYPRGIGAVVILWDDSRIGMYLSHFLQTFL